MRKIDKIIVHCSDSPDGRDDTSKDINRWHKKKGYKKIGYHYVIRRDGTVETGRELKEIGAHVRGKNRYSIGICLVGRSKFTDNQFESLYKLINDLNKSFSNLALYGHRDFTNKKTCPNFDVRKWFEKHDKEIVSFWGKISLFFKNLF